MSRQHFVLHDDTDIQDLFDDVENALDELQEQQNLLFVYAQTEETDDAKVHVWLERRKKDALVKLVDDLVIPARYLIVEAMIQEEVARIVTSLEKHVRFISLQELQQQANSKMTDDPRSLLLLALGTTETFDQTTFDIQLRGLRSSDTKVRYAATMSAGTTQWPEFIPELTTLSQTDPIPDIRDMASRSLEACQRRSPNREVLKNDEGEQKA
jgi:hypothetical protein